MESSSLDALLAWVGAHPWAAGAVIFAVAFSDAVVVLGLVVPALPILLGIGALIGLGSIDAFYALTAAATGAFAGDSLSYLVGRWQGERLRGVYPFSKHPEWLDRGERLLARHGAKAIVIARFVGAVRPLVPAIAGMLRVRPGRYFVVSALACVGWSVAFIAPGWLLGASLDLLAAVAGRLAILGIVLIALVGVIAWLVAALYGYFSSHANVLLGRLMRFTHRHPVLGRSMGALIDPRRPESPSLLLLAVVLVVAGWGFSTLLITLSAAEPLALDQALHATFVALRSPLADRPLAIVAMLGDWQVLLPPALAVPAWLFWRRRHAAAVHWLVAVGGGWLVMLAIGALVEMPKPLAAFGSRGFSFPSGPITMVAIVFGYFAVLIARELPGRRRVWPYLVAALATGMCGFARLYFGVHWLSDVLGGVLLGIVWTAVLGLAYRRRTPRSFWVTPASWIFFATLGLAATWHTRAHLEQRQVDFSAPEISQSLDSDDWWTRGWRLLPARRNGSGSPRAWPLNVQFAGDLDRLVAELGEHGFRWVATGDMTTPLIALDRSVTPDRLPFLPAAHEGQADAAVLVAMIPDQPESRLVLRLWNTSGRVGAERAPLYVGNVSVVDFARRLGWLASWQISSDHDRAVALLASALPVRGDLDRRRDDNILRIRARAPLQGQPDSQPPMEPPEPAD